MFNKNRMHTIVYTVAEAGCVGDAVRAAAKQGTLGTHGAGMAISPMHRMGAPDEGVSTCMRPWVSE
jgi:hypothetical protein